MTSDHQLMYQGKVIELSHDCLAPKEIPRAGTGGVLLILDPSRIKEDHGRVWQTMGHPAYSANMSLKHSLWQCGQIQKIGWGSSPNRENLYIL